MDQEERLATIVRLLRLRQSLALSPEDAGRTESALVQLRELRGAIPELNYFDAVRVTGNGSPDKRQVIDVIETALDRLASDRSLDFRLIEKVAPEAAADAAGNAVQNPGTSVLRSSPSIIGRWLLPAMLVVILGLAYVAYAQVKGLVAEAQQSQAAIENARVETLNAAAESRFAIDGAKVQASQQANEALQREVKQQEAEIRRAAKAAGLSFDARSKTIWAAKQKQELAAIDSHEKNVATELDGMPTYVQSLEQKVSDLEGTDANIAFVINHRADFEKPQDIINGATPGGNFALFLRLAALALALSLFLGVLALWFSVKGSKPQRR